MADFFATGNAVAFVLVFLVLELSVLILVCRKFSLGLQPLDLIAAVSAGAALLVGLRAALRSEPWQRIAICLIVALVCHLWDLRRRLATRRTA